jgi:hypothetical protein
MIVHILEVWAFVGVSLVNHLSITHVAVIDNADEIVDRPFIPFPRGRFVVVELKHEKNALIVDHTTLFPACIFEIIQAGDVPITLLVEVPF